MTHAAYLAAGYSITGVVLLAYAWRVVRRGRALARLVPPQERNW